MIPIVSLDISPFPHPPSFPSAGNNKVHISTKYILNQSDSFESKRKRSTSSTTVLVIVVLNVQIKRDLDMIWSLTRDDRRLVEGMHEQPPDSCPGWVGVVRDGELKPHIPAGHGATARPCRGKRHVCVPALKLCLKVDQTTFSCKMFCVTNVKQKQEGTYRHRANTGACQH